ncbi:MAG: DMT family transporter [Pseudomonadota bacterium]
MATSDPASTGASKSRDGFTDILAPALFVALWSTGWIAAGFSAPHADALTFLTVRYVLAALCLAAFAWVAGARWPDTPAAWAHACITGILMHAIYLGGVWWAVRHGVPAGISGIIVALQPILTAALATMLIGERVSALRWTGVLIGFVGLALVLTPGLIGETGTLAGLGLPLAINIIGMIAVTLGWFYQKRFIPTGDLRTVTTVQYIGAAVVTFPVALAFEDLAIAINMTTVLVMAWSVLALSIGAIALLLVLIRRGAVSRAAALVYLVPPATALQAWLFFDETLGPLQILGVAITVVGVALATRD